MRQLLTVIAAVLAVIVPGTANATVSTSGDPVAVTVELINKYRAKHGWLR